MPRPATHVEADMLVPNVDWETAARHYSSFATPSNPLISIILPVFNGESFLVETLEGVLHQSCRDWELIVLDDASTDDTWSLLQNHIGNVDNIVAIRARTNTNKRGVLALGLALAQGDFIMEINADDVLEPEAVESLLEPLVSAPQLDCAFGDHVVIDERGAEDVTRTKKAQRTSGRILLKSGWVDHPRERQLRSGIVPAGTCALIRKIAVGPWPSFSNTHTDYWLAWRAVRGQRVWYVAKALARYRVHNHNLTRSYYRRDKALDRMRMDWVILRESHPHEKPLVLRKFFKNALILAAGPNIVGGLGTVKRTFTKPEV